MHAILRNYLTLLGVVMYISGINVKNSRGAYNNVHLERYFSAAKVSKFKMSY